jgi:hypothetical protein
MNSSHDDFLQSILEYHSRPIDQAFIDAIMKRIAAKNKTRRWLISMAIVVAALIAAPMITDLLIQIEQLYQLTQNAPYMVAGGLSALIAVCTWLMSIELE